MPTMPKADLIKAFKLTERQAEDILEMRLRMLAKLEHIKVEQELDEKRKEQKGLEKILGSRKALEDLVVEEIEEDVKTFGDKRRTKIEEAEKAEIETPVIDEPVTRDLLAQGLGARAAGLGGRSRPRCRSRKATSC